MLGETKKETLLVSTMIFALGVAVGVIINWGVVYPC